MLCFLRREPGPQLSRRCQLYLCCFIGRMARELTSGENPQCGEPLFQRPSQQDWTALYKMVRTGGPYEYHWHVRKNSWVGGQRLVTAKDRPPTGPNNCARFVAGPNSSFVTSDETAIKWTKSLGLTWGTLASKPPRRRATTRTLRSNTTTPTPRMSIMCPARTRSLLTLGGQLFSLTRPPDRRPRRLPAPQSASRAAAPALASLALLAGVVVSGCGSGQLPEGPLGKQPENHSTVGQPVRRGGADTIGFDAVFNSGSAPAVMDRLVIRSPRHIKLVGAYVTIGGIVGNWATFPPAIPSARGHPYLVHIIAAWAQRHRAAGAVIPPHKLAGIALGLEATSAHGSIAGIDLFYHVGRTDYEWHGHTRIVLTSIPRTT